MADNFKQLEFDRDWRVNDTAKNGGFPTSEFNEEVVRADMQYLHEKTREYINGTLREAILAVKDKQDATFAEIPKIGSNGNWMIWSETKGDYVDSGITAWAGDMDSAIELAAKDAAEAVTLETLGAYSKEETLSDETKTLYGLGEEAKPDEVLEKIPSMVSLVSAAQFGTYVGDDTEGEVVTFEREPKMAILFESNDRNPTIMLPNFSVMVGAWGWDAHSYLPYLTATGIHTNLNGGAVYGNRLSYTYSYIVWF